ncbi:MAG: NAD(P)-dependent oxidoreductase [Acidobacteriaceae bacterium]|nr:NAD(P)-dependent oxidoreductase [Acidobacteriaceae bacterium]
MRIAFIGLGRMGIGMTRNLLRAGHQLTVYNRSREKAEALKADGAEATGSPAEACQNAQVAFTMLADDSAVADTVFGEHGIAAGLPQGAIHISSSTISANLARRLTAEHAAKGQGYLSAPVFGRPDAAENKKLIVVAGGKTEEIERVRFLLEAVSRAVFIAGREPFHANLFKLCGNFMLSSMLETFGEAFATLRKSGADHHAFLEIMNELFGSPVYKNYGTTIADEKFEPAGFALKLGLKDVRLVLEAAGEVDAPMPLASLLRDQLLTAMSNGQEQLDWSSISQVASRNAGLTIDRNP